MSDVAATLERVARDIRDASPESPLADRLDDLAVVYRCEPSERHRLLRAVAR
jgi:hypothetical protein